MRYTNRKRRQTLIDRKPVAYSRLLRAIGWLILLGLALLGLGIGLEGGK